MGFDCVEVTPFFCRQGFGYPNPRISVAGADFEDVFYVVRADNLVQKEPGFF